MYQRASAVQSDVSYTTTGNASVAIAQRFPEGYTGIATDSRATIMKIARLTPDFAQIMQEYSVRSNITVPHGDCGDTCTASVKVIITYFRCLAKLILPKGIWFQDGLRH